VIGESLLPLQIGEALQLRLQCSYFYHMASMGDKQLEADGLMKKANKYWAPSLLDFRLKPDWDAAAPLLERAGLLYKVSIVQAAHIIQ